MEILSNGSLYLSSCPFVKTIDFFLPAAALGRLVALPQTRPEPFLPGFV
jgi:hypothetical protein